MTTNEQPATTKRIFTEKDKDEVIRMLKHRESFENCRLEGIHFYRHTFNHKVNLSNAELHNVSFYLNEFSEYVHFYNTKFSGFANFGGVKFSEEAIFEGATFSEEAWFWSATFSKRADFIGEKLFSKDYTTTFSYVKFENNGCINLESAYLGKTFFQSTDLMKIDFTGVKWGTTQKRYLFSILKKERVCLYDELQLHKYEQVPQELCKIEKLYTKLKQNYEKSGVFNCAGDFHYGELEMRKRSCKKKWERFLYLMYESFSGYGEHSGQALLVLFFFHPFIRLGASYDRVNFNRR